MVVVAVVAVLVVAVVAVVPAAITVSPKSSGVDVGLPRAVACVNGHANQYFLGGIALHERASIAAVSGVWVRLAGD